MSFQSQEWYDQDAECLICERTPAELDSYNVVDVDSKDD